MQTEQDIVDYIEQIDAKFLEGKKAKWSRFGVEWGTWSRKMNLEIRAKLEAGDHPQPLLLKMILPYWLLKSQLLELYHKSKHYGQAKKMRTAKEAREMKEDILGNRMTGDDDFSMHDFQRSILQSV